MAKRAKNELDADQRVIARATCKPEDLDNGRGRTEYRIKGFPGLVLRVFETGQASWYAAYTIQAGGRSVTKRVKIDDRRMHYSEAGKIAADYMKKAREGQDPALQKQLARTAIQIGALVQKRLDAAELAGDLKDSTVSQQRELTKLFFDCVPGFKLRPADKITPTDMRAALQAFVVAGTKRKEGRDAGQPYSGKTRDIVKMAISAAYKWGQDQGHCENNPVRDIRNSSTTKPRTNFADSDAIKALWKACAENDAPLSQDMRDVIRLALLTGQRRGEVAQMCASQIDLKAKVWTLPGDKQEYRNGKTVTVRGLTKNGQEHVVPLSNEALAIVSAAMKRAGVLERLFDVSPGAVTMAMRRLRDKYQIDEVTVHSLRRTISRWAGKQRDIRAEAIEGLLNHQPRADDVTRRHYQQERLTDEVREVLERWGRHVMAVVSTGEDQDGAGAVRLSA